jgi:hypothetical protein
VGGSGGWNLYAAIEATITIDKNKLAIVIIFLRWQILSFIVEVVLATSNETLALSIRERRQIEYLTTFIDHEHSTVYHTLNVCELVLEVHVSEPIRCKLNLCSETLFTV